MFTDRFSFFIHKINNVFHPNPIMFFCAVFQKKCNNAEIEKTGFYLLKTELKIRW